ncbi:hypothetical protein [Nostoc sp. ChiSLP03a]|uniref:WD40 repeat domain-containing protein n=1 Tax=Nostoc sp. ChiSLP03a TaxID=3075380 RepID=UPI002AD42850|nr:hypothetical protein [Nostoc sp. ChiSLP03a]MDZ8214291.1 hypothetical protein [Nostoc sp. ChiSLP03a]
MGFLEWKKINSFSVKNLRPPTSREDAIIAINLEFKYLVSSHDEEIKVWNIDNNKLLRTVNLAKYEINDVLMTKNLLLALPHPQMKLYDLKNGKLIRSFVDMSGSLKLLHVSADGKIMIGVEEYNSFFEHREEKLKIWNIKTGQER